MNARQREKPGTPGLVSISSTTRALKEKLDDHLARIGDSEGVGDATVTLVAPDRVDETYGSSPCLNLFLYRIAPHLGLKNQLTERPDSLPNGRETLFALDLHYLLSVHSVDDSRGEVLLEIALRALADHEDARSRRPGDRRAAQANEDVQSETPTETEDHAVEPRVIPEFMSLEEESRLWTALQAKLRPSIVFKVGPVHISGVLS